MRYDTNMKQKRDKGKASRGIFHYDLPQNGTERGKNGQSLSSPGVFLPRHCSIILPQKIGRGNEEREGEKEEENAFRPMDMEMPLYWEELEQWRASERQWRKRGERRGKEERRTGLCNTF